ncbi:MAG TPA: hypothetical protein VLM85_23520 [Polyangiaceae bacterium]|nr:hypothetical protein [Polyangiaceae bacterium]
MPKVLEWHRVDGAVLGPLALGAFVLLMGPTLGVFAFVVFKGVAALKIGIAIVAAVCVVVGPAIAVVKLATTLREDASLAARVDGVVFERNGKSAFLAWDTIERVEFEEPSTLRILRSGDEPFVLHERFATIGCGELAKRLEELRRKAAFGLLGKDHRGASRGAGD